MEAYLQEFRAFAQAIVDDHSKDVPTGNTATDMVARVQQLHAFHKDYYYKMMDKANAFMAEFADHEPAERSQFEDALIVITKEYMSEFSRRNLPEQERQANPNLN
ncbi:MAG: hypothetical protein EOP56_01875 [Sphingobacteriales bacterium]|nr:MAG: hypothetical protein EOP56_01875 [Sphingobacteriales bacterium]